MTVAQLLLNRGAEVDTKDNDGCTSLHLSCRKGPSASFGDPMRIHHADWKVFEMLLDRGADVEAKIDKNLAPLSTRDSARERSIQEGMAFCPPKCLSDHARRKYQKRGSESHQVTRNSVTIILGMQLYYCNPRIWVASQCQHILKDPFQFICIRLGSQHISLLHQSFRHEQWTR